MSDLTRLNKAGHSTLPNSIATVLMGGWARCSDTVGAAHSFVFDQAAIDARKQDLLDALRFLEAVEAAKHRTSILAHQVVTKLPRELRDMIYSHLIPGHSVHLFDPKYLKYLPSGSSIGYTQDELTIEIVSGVVTFTPSPHNNSPQPLTPVYYTLPYQPSHEAMGAEVAGELQQYFYEKARFHFGSMRYQFVLNLLDQHAFSLPGRNISVSIKICHEDPDYLTDEVKIQRQNSRVQCLDRLAARPGKGMDLMVIVDGASESLFGDDFRTLVAEEPFQEALDLIFPRLVALQDAGYKTSLVVDPRHTHTNYEKFVSVQDFEYIFTPKNAKFSPERYMDKMREYVRLRDEKLQAAPENQEPDAGA